jgi:riboflavin synthase
MFTGLVESVGTIIDIVNTNEGKIFTAKADLVENDLKPGDSISISGACQTVTRLSEDRSVFEFYSSFKTLELTNFNTLKVGDSVNLERSILPSTRLGGHFVQGHVDAVGEILSRQERDGGKTVEFSLRLPEDLKRYVVSRGSIAVDGISLTVVDVQDNIIILILITETLKKTIAGDWKKGSIVNLETDILARYFEKWKMKP